jgi:hypothetical protein
MLIIIMVIIFVDGVIKFIKLCKVNLMTVGVIGVFYALMGYETFKIYCESVISVEAVQGSDAFILTTLCGKTKQRCVVVVSDEDVIDEKCVDVLLDGISVGQVKYALELKDSNRSINTRCFIIHTEYANEESIEYIMNEYFKRFFIAKCRKARMNTKRHPA